MLAFFLLEMWKLSVLTQLSDFFSLSLSSLYNKMLRFLFEGVICYFKQGWQLSSLLLLCEWCWCLLRQPIFGKHQLHFITVFPFFLVSISSSSSSSSSSSFFCIIITDDDGFVSLFIIVCDVAFGVVVTVFDTESRLWTQFFFLFNFVLCTRLCVSEWLSMLFSVSYINVCVSIRLWGGVCKCIIWIYSLLRMYAYYYVLCMYIHITVVYKSKCLLVCTHIIY